MKTQQPTERGLAPSCSSFEKYEMCPGSYNLCLGVAEGPSGPAAQLGTDVHATLAGEAFHLTPEGEAIHNECADAYQKLARKIMPDGPMLTYLEKRLWYNREWSGQADRIDLFESGQSALVVDYKTGRGRVPRAEENLQLRGLAVLAKFRFPMLRRIDVAIIAPRSNGTTYCSYTEGELEIARQEIVRLIKNLHEEDAPRHPSPKACRFCRAKKICPEVTGIAQKLVAAPVRTSKELSADKLAESLGTAEILEGLIKDLREEAKRRLSEGSEVPGYELSPGRITRF